MAGTQSPQKSFIKKLNPMNKNEEMRKFLFDPLYNPQFLYEDRIDGKDFLRYGRVSDEHLEVSKKILEHVINKWGSETAFLEQSEGELLTKEDLLQTFKAYLKENDLEGQIRIQFVPRAISPASINDDLLSIRLPIAQRQKRILGTLHHEIGTHFFRRFNDKKQPWHGKKLEFGFSNYLETEEGLASIHAHMFLDEPVLWFPALYYYLVYHASKMSFSELFAHAKKYVDNRERRWNMCVRVKRGLMDTSLPGAFSKDQVYLRGVIHMTRWLQDHEFDPTPLYIGDINEKDLIKAQHLNPGYVPATPAFLRTQKTVYAEHILKLLKVNGL